MLKLEFEIKPCRCRERTFSTLKLKKYLVPKCIKACMKSCGILVVGILMVFHLSSIDYAASDEDYASFDGTVNFPKNSGVGVEEMCQLIAITNDADPEPMTEVFSVSLADTSNLDDIIIRGPLSINVTISDCK